MTSLRMAIAEVLRPFHRWAPRGYGLVYRTVLGKHLGNYHGDQELKQRLARRYRVFRDDHLGAYVCADLGDWAGRSHYYKRIYYDRTAPLLIVREFSGGGSFIDVGANRGLHSLYLSPVLDGNGQVCSFEPNPDTFDILKTHIVMNALRNCTPINIGVSDAKGELKLNLFSDDHSGTCSFVASGQIAGTDLVPVRRLDEALEISTLRGPVLVKIDVEGFEHQVIKGMKRLLSRPDVTVICDSPMHGCGRRAVRLRLWWPTWRHSATGCCCRRSATGAC